MYVAKEGRGIMADKDEAAAERQLVVFSLAGEAYGVDIEAVREIIRMEEITQVPNAPEFVEGVINLRGMVCPVLDLRKRLGVDVSETTNESRIVVVEIDGEQVGLIVDEVTEVLRIGSESVEAASDVIAAGGDDLVEAIVSVDDRMILLMDLRAALSSKKDADAAQVEAAAA